MKRFVAQRLSSWHPGLSVSFYDLAPEAALLPPGIVLPEQFYHSSMDAKVVSGEVALMRAIFEDALICFQKSGSPGDRKLAQDAEQWFFANDPHWPFSFVNICEALRLNPGYIRLGLQRWRQNPLRHSPRQRRHGGRAQRLCLARASLSTH